MIRTVLYAHGLESGPRGKKAQHLAQAGFDVVSEQMPCGRAQIARDPMLYAAAASGALALSASGRIAGVRGVGAFVAVAALSAPYLKARLMRRVFRRSVAVQLATLAAHPVDAVVGSSFGGGVALDLLLERAWSGPTVLLCPAHRLIAERARREAPPGLASLPGDVSARVVVVHGRGDEIVPLDHSEALVAGSRARLVVVDDDHRLSASATPENLAEWIAMASARESGRL